MLRQHDLAGYPEQPAACPYKQLGGQAGVFRLVHHGMKRLDYTASDTKRAVVGYAEGAPDIVCLFEGHPEPLAAKYVRIGFDDLQVLKAALV